jgi:hypothetical protein
VQPLDYSAPAPRRSDPWRQVVNAFAVAAIVWGATALVISGRRYMNAGWREFSTSFGTSDRVNVVFFADRIVVDVTSLGLLVGGLGCARRWSWARRAMLVSSIGVLAGSVIELLLESTVTQGARSLDYFIMTAPYYVNPSIFPVLLIWLMTREQARRQFGLSKPSGPEGDSDAT